MRSKDTDLEGVDLSLCSSVRWFPLRRRPQRPGRRREPQPALGLLGWLVSAWLVVPLSAAAEAQPHVHLAWERPIGSTCPPANVLEADVEQTLDRPVFTSLAQAQLRIQGVIEENASGGTWVRLTARHRNGTLLGTRELRSAAGGCAALRSDIVLVLTLLVDERLSSDPSPALRMELGATGTALLHVLPRWSAGAGPTLVLSLGSLQLRADLAYFLPVVVRTTSGIQASLRAASVSLRVCQGLFAGESSPFSLHLCAGAQGGAWLISQSAPDARPMQLRLLAHGLVDVRAGLRLSDDVKLELAAGPSFSLHRTSLYAYYEDEARVLLYRVPLLGMQIQLGLLF